MIVYGDPSYEEEFPTLLRYLHGCMKLSGSPNFSGLEALDRLRWLLIFAGQIQQGLEDATEATHQDSLFYQKIVSEGRNKLRPYAAGHTTKEFIPSLNATTFSMQTVTEHLAAVFVALIAEFCDDAKATNSTRNGVIDTEDSKINVGATLSSLADLIPEWETAPRIRLMLKAPEGYAFYALYPEQYAVSALRWAREHAGEAISQARVIGIRSIGISLAAVVRAALQSAGVSAVWQTVRPTGHPYERQADLGSLEIKPDEWALIVDEGPGQSGSSMASVAQALVNAGTARNRIAFLPGHGGNPGGAGNETARQWWESAARYVTPTFELRWNGLALPDALAAQTPQLVQDYVEYKRHEGEACNIVCGEDVRVTLVEDFGGGLWRNTVYGNEAEWPAVCAAFERPKYRVTLSNGTRVLWKYAGLATVPLPNLPISPTAKREGWLSQSHVMEQWLGLRKVTPIPLPPAPLGAAMGFVATLWIDGTSLTLADAAPAFLAEMGNYIGACSAPPLTLQEHAAALNRLQSLLYWNTWEALGEDAAEQTRQWSAILEQSEWARQARTFGDGHLAPHEWLRTPEGRLHKTDCIGYEPDHTIVGRQSAAWDVAGALVEWRLEKTVSAPLLNAAQEALYGLMLDKQAPDTTIPPDVLTAYQLAYAAFRAGQTHLCANMSAYDPNEQARLWQAYTCYKDTLARLLQI